MKLAFSYIRFSSKKQELGDSQRRQIEGAKSWCQRHGATLDERNFQDLGVSAWRGKNFAVGALGAFLDAVKSGTISKGCYLIVENLDRTSRQEPLTSLNLLDAIIK